MTKLRLITDGDDTCWYCRHNYHAADCACLALVIRALGIAAPAPHEVLHRAKRVERAAMRERGYRFNQFEDAWVETYRSLAELAGLTVDPYISTAIFEEANYVKRADYPPYPDIYRVLATLRPMVESIHLLSLGDYDFQMKKVRRNKLEGHFDSMHITEGDKGLVMQELAGGGVPTVMIGDNMNTDIEPALALGLTAVWLKNSSLWAQSDRGLDSRVHIIEQLNELPPLIERLSLGPSPAITSE